MMFYDERIWVSFLLVISHCRHSLLDPRTTLQFSFFFCDVRMDEIWYSFLCFDSKLEE
jgi:hypothetical protein